MASGIFQTMGQTGRTHETVDPEAHVCVNQISNPSCSIQTRRIAQNPNCTVYIVYIGPRPDGGIFLVLAWPGLARPTQSFIQSQRAA